MKISFLKMKVYNNGYTYFLKRISTKVISNFYNIRYKCKISYPLSTKIFGRNFIHFGQNIIIGERCKIEAVYSHGKHIYNPRINIGDGTTMNDDVHIGCIERIDIGKNVLMASRIYISDHNHGSYNDPFHDNPRVKPNSRKLFSRKVVIGDNVWLGEGVVVLPGVTIGEGSIIGANSVVTKDLPRFSISAGVPARVIKVYNTESGKWEIAK